MRYLVKPRVRIFVKIYGLLSFDKNKWKNFTKTISENLSSKYFKKLLDHANQSTTDAHKAASKK